MKGIFWNSNGFAYPKKNKFVSDITREYNLNFIAISETGRSEFRQNFLRNLCAGKDFIWHSKAPKGRSSGILLGIDLNEYDIGVISEGDFFVKFQICNKSDNFKWSLVVVYGPAQQNLKESFFFDRIGVYVFTRKFTSIDWW